MKLQLRFFLVLAAIFIVAASFLLIEQKFEIDRSSKVLASEMKERKIYFHNIVTLDGYSEQTLSEDYSFWDDMVTFVKDDNIQWAQENLDTGLSTFNVDADWVYKPNGQLLYFSSLDGTNTLKPINLPQNFFSSLTRTKFAHFYVKESAGILEIRAATIVGSNDPNHTTPEQGFWLVGRLLSSGYTQNIANLSGSRVSLAPASDSKDDSSDDTVSFGQVLDDWTGHPLAVLRSMSTVTVISDLKQQYTQQLEILAAFTIVAVVLVIGLLYLLVLIPLNTINKAIKLQRPDILDKLKNQDDELGKLAQTVVEFFHQKITLAEEQFRRNELEKLNREKSSFLAVAAHELNNPVANIKLFAEYLMFVLKKHDEKAVDVQVKRLEKASVRINILLNDLKAASEGKQNIEFSKRNFDFDSFLKEEIAESSFSSKHRLNLKTETKVNLLSDPDRLGQVVTNLIRNASKYSPQNSDINIHAEVKDGNLLVGVQDFGIGVSPEDAAHLFERYFRSDKVTGKYPGLGLGLYISKSIVEGLGGKMWVDSKLNEGSTFYFSLPVKAPAPTSTPSNPIQTPVDAPKPAVQPNSPPPAPASPPAAGDSPKA